MLVGQYFCCPYSSLSYHDAHAHQLNRTIDQNFDIMSATPANVTSQEEKTAEETADFANYFCTYGFLYHQKQMLTDSLRMEAYYSAVFENSEHFKDKVVLDVGTGSGILAMWSARAGAKKVYAVEYTDMAKMARKLVNDNGFEDVVEVIQGGIEKVDLPEKVDIIISEWMGYFLMRESMIDSVIIARDRFLKPGGAMYPSHCKLYVAPIVKEMERSRCSADFQNSMENWGEFLGTMQRRFGVKFDSLSNNFRREQEQYFLETSHWVELQSDVVCGTKDTVMEIDMLTCTVDEVKELRDVPFSIRMTREDTVSAFAGWFDVDFKGSPAQPSRRVVTLGTGPELGYTHWGQQAFYLQPGHIPVKEGDEIRGTMDMTRRADNRRLLNVKFSYRPYRKNAAGECVASEDEGVRTTMYQIE